MESTDRDALRRFREALKIPTWWPPGALPGDSAAEAPLRSFQEFLAENYPAFHLTAERWVLSPYSLVYRWAGTSGGNDGAVLLLAHYDVVPAETEKWSVDPFGAEVKGGCIYGRGSLDMKGILSGIMEAAETLCAAGHRPGRDIWFAFGGDEERTGIQGAMETARWFSRRGQRFEWILDEGTPIAEGQIKGIDTPLALISMEEKGFLSLDLRVAQEPGHASRPPDVQAAAVLGRALCRIAKRPFPCRLVPAAEHFFREAAPFMKGIPGFVMRHARVFGPLFFAAVSSSPAIMSMLRTTVAMTQLEGSAADNVMPSEVRAVINLRLLQPWTVERAMTFIKKAINDERVQVTIHGLGTGPVPAGGGGSSGLAAIRQALNAAWPGIPMLPFIMVATTDSRHYRELAGDIFRFSPHCLTAEALSGIHGHDERISEENFRRGLLFYTKLLGAL
ncbi:MAG: M20/M25/M40 family metallo-hydrolase [Treponema sp.]|jgi:carboxypeptidase PM20D1|nr:M20/M25/M40 family metallo-hydrolase [Treponema sp.]